MTDPKLRTGAPGGLQKAAWLHYIPALIAAVAIALFGFYADWQRIQTLQGAEKVEVAQRLNLDKTKLEALISRNVAIVQGLTLDIAEHDALDQEHFSELAARIMALAPQIRNLAVAPDLKVSLVYPLAGNEDVLGLDYNKNPAQKAAALRVKEMGKALVTGPIDLVQGGRGLIARFPLLQHNADGDIQFLGLLSAVMDMERLYRAAGLRISDPDIRTAMRLRASDGSTRPAFFGDPTILEQSPVKSVINLGLESWELFAIPSEDWGYSVNRGPFRLILLVVAFVLVAPLVWVGKLNTDRQKHLVALHEREEQLAELSQRLELALTTSGIGVWEYDISQDRLSWDERMREIYGVAQDQEICTVDDWRSALHPEDMLAAEKSFTEAIESETEYSSGFRVVGRNGEVRHIKAVGAVYEDSSGGKKIIGANWDVTDDVLMQEELRLAKSKTELQNRHLVQAKSTMEHAALHDALTGLANRRYLDQRLHEIHEGHYVTVLHIDLDRFKEINDTFGHAAGDLILKEAARNLRALIYPGDFLARIGGDEFVVISAPENAQRDYAHLANNLVSAMSRPVLYNGHECRVGASIGFASGNTTNESAGQILINADIALYEAKRRGRNRVEPFTENLRQTAVNNKHVADDILRAFEQKQFVAYYQPQFCSQTYEILGFEALVRWNHPEKGLLTPDAFLKIAESLKVVSSIDAIVLDQAYDQFQRLQANGVNIPKFSVNLSAQRLKEEALFEKMSALPFKPGSLSVELLESISFEGDDQELSEQIDRLRDIGVDIEIDDFGTGRASILTLLKLMPRRLKIDRQLVFPIVESANQRALVRSIVDIGRSRGIEIIAEGVETMQHAEILRDLGCHALQGYAFARPMSGQDFLNFAKRREWLAA